jgi:hypothetical protein
VGVFALVAVVLILGGRPAVSQASAPPTLGVGGPSQVTMPDGVLLSLSSYSEAPGDVNIAVWDHNWNSLGGCLGGCTKRYLTGALQGGTHPVEETFHVEAFAPDGQNSGFVDKTVTFNPVDWQVSLDMPSGVSMPDAIPATVSVSPVTPGGPSAVLIDADTLNYPFPGINCATWQGLCSGNVSTGWFGAVPVVKNYRAEMLDGTTTVAADTKTVTIYPPSIGPTLTVPSFVLPDHTYTVKITNSYNQWTPYTIELRDGNGNVVGTCTVDQATCQFTFTAGAEGSDQSFTAAVTYAGTTLSQTSPVKVTATDPTIAGANDGIDIATLAGLFGSISNVCNSLLFYPGTHVQDTSTSDQENACVAASEASGATVEYVIRASLLAMAAAAGAASGQSLLAWLLNWAWTHGGITPPWVESYPTIDPPASTPVPAAATADAIADSIVARDTATTAISLTDALKIARSCLLMTGNAGMSSDLCKTRAIFVPGSDFPQPTQHRIDALDPDGGYPPWVVLKRRASGVRDNWYRTQPECIGSTTAWQCDEFPENSTYEGGNPNKPGNLKHPPSLRKLDGPQNRDLGGRLINFYNRCQIPDAGQFLVVPLAPSLGIPTQWTICKAP